MKKISHITINTGHVAQYEDEVVNMDKFNICMKEIIKRAIVEGESPVMDNTIVQIMLNDDKTSYVATLCLNDEAKTPLAKTVGALTECEGKRIWTIMKTFFGLVYGNGGTSKECPNTPFICDMIYPTIGNAPFVMKWFNEFTKCFGIEMLEALEIEQMRMGKDVTQQDENESFEDIMLFSEARESVKEWVFHGFARKGTYKGLPEELKPYQYWLADSGNVVMVVPESLLQQAIEHGNLSDYEVGVACSYVLKKGYRFYEGYVIVDVPYDDRMGVMVEEEDW